MAAPVVGDDPVALLKEEEHLPVPVIGRQQPSVAEHDRLSLAPVLVMDLDAVGRRDSRHGSLLLISWWSVSAVTVRCGVPDCHISGISASIVSMNTSIGPWY